MSSGHKAVVIITMILAMTWIVSWYIGLEYNLKKEQQVIRTLEITDMLQRSVTSGQWRGRNGK